MPAAGGYEILIEDGKVSAHLVHFWPGNAIGIKTKVAIPLDRWVHVTMTYDGSSRASGLRLYLDGRQADCEVVRDSLTKNITGGGGDELTVGQLPAGQAPGRARRPVHPALPSRLGSSRRLAGGHSRPLPRDRPGLRRLDPGPQAAGHARGYIDPLGR